MRGERKEGRKKRKRTNGIPVCRTFLFCVTAAAAVCIAQTAAPVTARAEEVTAVSGDGEITVLYDAVPVSGDEERRVPFPPDSYVWQEEEYRLKSCQLVTVTMPELVKYVRQSVLYGGTENAAEVPETIDAVIRDEESGRSARVRLPLEHTAASGWHWEDGFAFPVTVRGYDAGSFFLGGETVEVREEQPFAGYENALLELIGVDPAYYRIDSTEWSGPPQEGENGTVSRSAMALGQKYVADIEAVYGGRAVIPEQPGMAYEAVYVLEKLEETEPVTEAEYAEVIVIPAPVEEEVPEETPEESGIPWLVRNLRQVTTVVVGIGLFLGPLLFLLIRRRRKEKRKGDAGTPDSSGAAGRNEQKAGLRKFPISAKIEKKQAH